MIHCRSASAAAILAAIIVVLIASARDADTQDNGARPLTLAGTLRELPSVAAAPSGQPQLAVSVDGRVVLSWMERLGDTRRHAFRYAFRDAAGWTTPRTIVERDDFFVNWADVPSVFPLRGGALIAHWLQKNGAGTYAYDVRLAVSDSDARTWSADRKPYTDTSESEHGFGSFFNWPGGGAGLVWLDGRELKPGGHGGHGGGGAMTLRAARVTEDGSATSDTLLDARVCECCPTAAIATSRGAIVAYRDRSDTEVRDIAVMRFDNGKWEGPTYVHEDRWQINACPVNGPALAAIGDRVALAWFTAQGDVPRAMLAFSTDGGKSFGKPVRLDDVQTLGRVDVVMLDDGRAVASWLEFIPGGSEFRARIVAPNGTRGPHFTVTTSSADRQSGYPRMVRTGNELIFAWTATRPTPQVKTAALTLP